MAQDQNSGRQANEFGKRMGRIVAEKIGAQPLNPNGNEFLWHGKRITIRSAHRNTSYVGALYAMLDRVVAVLAALETSDSAYFQVWELDKATFLAHARPQTKNPFIAQSSTKVFPKHGTLVAKVTDTE